MTSSTRFPLRMKTSTNFFSGGLAGLLFVLVAGCSWNKPASESFASVLITNATADAIQKTTIKVFQGDDYLSHYMDPDSGTLVFEKEGSKGQSIAYNGLVGTHEGQVTLTRVKVRLIDRGDGSFRLSCQAFIVRDAGTMGGDEIKLGGMRSGPYQKLLDEVADRLKTPKP
jgi:hypothetical protein